MIATITEYECVKDAVWSKRIDLLGDDIEVVLCGEGYVPMFAKHAARADLREMIGKAAVLTGKAIRKIDGKRFFVADDPTWTFGFFASFRRAVVVDATADVLMACVDFGETLKVPLFTLAWSEQGIFRL